jgi:hypothetical protein
MNIGDNVTIDDNECFKGVIGVISAIRLDPETLEPEYDVDFSLIPGFPFSSGTCRFLPKSQVHPATLVAVAAITTADLAQAREPGWDHDILEAYDFRDKKPKSLNNIRVLYSLVGPIR